MPDISMCKGTDCKFKEYCWRFVAPPTPNWQPYFVDVPVNGETCEYFWPTNGNKTAKKIYNKMEKLINANDKD